MYFPVTLSTVHSAHSGGTTTMAMACLTGLRIGFETLALTLICRIGSRHRPVVEVAVHNPSTANHRLLVKANRR